MRHRNSGRKLGRTSSHREAMFKNMACSLIHYGHINTTLAKAKELRGVIEPLITRALTDSVPNRRLVFARLGGDRVAVTKLFNVIARQVAGRPGGYTRVLKAGFRAGDAAPMAIIELIDRQAKITEEAA